MQDYLKHYNLRITALAPIHVGDGGKLGKKEYIQYSDRGMVIVPDTAKMFGDLQQHRLDKAYEDFILNSSYNMDLGRWLSSQRIYEQYSRRWTLYSMDPGDAFMRRAGGGGGTPKEILTFMKDPYGLPYIPGSTLKGMLRTALICWRIHQDPGRYKDKISDIMRSASDRASRNTYLKSKTAALEAAVFHTLERTDRKDNAVNSIMSGFIVSDSAPLPLSQLVLAQKIDYTLRRQEKPLPILREALKPGSQIDFELTIDTKTCNITIEEIFSALDYFQQVSYDCFYSRFGRGTKAKGTVWLGGGIGFLSKTILYPVCGKEALRTADKVFQATLNKIYSTHKHNNDISNGVAPHVCKCTRYGGQLYDMGMGKIELIH